MIPNNNLSVLPFYDSIEQQNARKWWIYGRIYPLFTPAGFILPFQILREHSVIYTPGVMIGVDDSYNGHILLNGEVVDDPEDTTTVYEYDVDGLPTGAVYFRALYAPESEMYASAVALNDNLEVLGVFRPEFHSDGEGHMVFQGGWDLPTGTYRICVQGNGGTLERGYKELRGLASLEIYDKNGALVGDYSSIIPEITIKSFESRGYDVIVYPGTLPAFAQFQNGQYYIKLTDGVNTWFSEIFTVVNDIAPYLKITWWDVQDFVMDAGAIVYTEPAFKNVLYLDSDIAKPDYTFDEEGENRDGYFYPTKQISEKHYRFKFFASEYLLDVMRLIRMADFAEIEYNGKRYSLDTFLITPEWEDNGDVAAVEAEFETATVAKKIGLGYIKAQRGDFNDDFNNDFNN